MDGHMKQRSLVLSFLALLCTLLTGTDLSGVYAKGQVPDHGGKIETKYDGFNHETVVILKKMRITCAGSDTSRNSLKGTCVSIVASLHSPGMQLDYVRYARLQLIFETKDWDRRHTPDQRELSAVADGEKVKLGKMHLINQDVDSHLTVEVMKEVLEVSIPYQTFTKLALAESLEMKVGNTLFELGGKNLAAFRDLNNRVRF